MPPVMLDAEAPAAASEADRGTASNAFDVSSVQRSWAALEFATDAATAVRPTELFAVEATGQEPLCPLVTEPSEDTVATNAAFDDLTEQLHDDDAAARLEAPFADFDDDIVDEADLDAEPEPIDFADDEAADEDEPTTSYAPPVVELDSFEDFVTDEIEIIADPEPEPAGPPPIPEVYFEEQPLLPHLGEDSSHDFDLFDDGIGADDFATPDPAGTSGLGNDHWDVIHQESRRTGRKTKTTRRRLFSAGIGKEHADAWDADDAAFDEGFEEDDDVSIAERLEPMGLNLVPIPSLAEDPAPTMKPIDLAEILAAVHMPCDLAPIPGDAQGFGSRSAAYFTTLYRTLEIGVAVQKELNAIGMKLQTISPGRAVASNGTNTLLVTLHDNAKNFPSVPVYSVVVEIELV